MASSIPRPAQLDMKSNGKSVRLDGSRAADTGPIVGEPAPRTERVLSTAPQGPRVPSTSWLRPPHHQLLEQHDLLIANLFARVRVGLRQYPREVSARASPRISRRHRVPGESTQHHAPAPRLPPTSSVTDRALRAIVSCRAACGSHTCQGASSGQALANLITPSSWHRGPTRQLDLRLIEWYRATAAPA